jgi:hypothetical protein
MAIATFSMFEAKGAAIFQRPKKKLRQGRKKIRWKNQKFSLFDAIAQTSIACAKNLPMSYTQSTKPSATTSTRGRRNNSRSPMTSVQNRTRTDQRNTNMNDPNSR